MSPEKSSDHKAFTETYKAEIVLMIITLSWGMSFPLLKISLNFISPFLFLFLRFFITVTVFYFIFRSKLDLSKFNEWKNGIILGIFLFSGFAFQTIGLKYTSASKSAFITGTSLIVIPFAQYFILKLKPRPENITGALIVLAGLYILSEVYFSDPNAGDMLTLISALSFAIYVVLLNKYATEINFNYLAFGQFLTMSVLSIIFVLIFEVFIYNEIFFIPDAVLLLTLFYTSVFSTLISIILISRYQRETTPLRASIIYNMEAVSAVFFSFIILGEVLNFNQMTGAFIMIAGLVISEFYIYLKIKI